MRIVRGIARWAGIALAAAVVALLLTAVAARFADGPLGLFPGGPLESGELVTSEPDWSFARDVPSMELQLQWPRRSRTVWLLVHDDRLFVVSGYMNTRIGRFWKRWPLAAERDGRAVVRVEGRRYPRRLVRIHDDPALFEALAAEARRKYGVDLTAEVIASGGAWIFEARPEG